MSDIIIKFRDKDTAVQYSNVDKLMPFGSQGVAVAEVGGGLLVVPMARITEILVIPEEVEEEEAPEIIV